MVNLILLAISLLIGSGICKPTYSDYSDYGYDLLNLTSFQQESADELSLQDDEFVIAKRDLSVTKDNISANLTGQQTILLTDIIARVEGSLIHSAFDIVSVFKLPNQTNTDKLDGATENVQIFKDKLDDGNQTITNLSASLVPASSKLPAHNIQSSATKVEGTLETYSSETGKQKRSISTTTTTISGMEEGPPSSTITATSLSTETAHSTEVVKHDHTAAMPNIESNKSPVVVTSTVSSAQPIKGVTSLPNTKITTSTPLLTTVTPTPITTVTATTKNPVKELKKTEEVLKEKVAEIQAEPVILSSRI